MTPRTIAIGDTHGCSTALAALIEVIDPRPEDTVVALGDFVDRGIDSRGVLDLLVDLQRRCHLVPILGNHDEMLLAARSSRAAFRRWIEFGGGITTLDSYPGDSGRMSLIPAAHISFLERCVPHYEIETHFFAHAGYQSDLPLDRHDGHTLRWRSLHDGVPAPHKNGKVAVVGHTPHAEVLDLGYLLCIDTGSGLGGVLTAVEVTTRQTWQADERGRRLDFRATPGNERVKGVTVLNTTRGES